MMELPVLVARKVSKACLARPAALAVSAHPAAMASMDRLALLERPAALAETVSRDCPGPTAPLESTADLVSRE